MIVIEGMLVLVVSTGFFVVIHSILIGCVWRCLTFYDRYGRGCCNFFVVLAIGVRHDY
jgi:hypothetical protein